MAMLSICSKEELSGADKDDNGKIILLLIEYRLGSKETSCSKQDQGYWQNVQSLWYIKVI